MSKGGYVYLLTNNRNTVLYIGVTSELEIRIHEHINKTYPQSFTARYNVCKLIYFEFFDHIEEAIEREKQLKGTSRKKKEEIISKVNPLWNDLIDTI